MSTTKVSTTVLISVPPKFQNVNILTYLGVQYGERVDPNPPAPKLILDGVMEKHAEERHDHVSDLLLFRVVGVDVGHGEQPVLPHRHLQHRPENTHSRYRSCKVGHALQHQQELTHTAQQ